LSDIINPRDAILKIAEVLERDPDSIETFAFHINRHGITVAINDQVKHTEDSHATAIALIREFGLDANTTAATVEVDRHETSFAVRSFLFADKNEAFARVLRTVNLNAACDIAQMSSAESQHEQTSSDVRKVVEHLNNNRTTETEARNLQEAARRSLSDHAASKAFGR
jgi:hypothetical protein